MTNPIPPSNLVPPVIHAPGHSHVISVKTSGSTSGCAGRISGGHVMTWVGDQKPDYVATVSTCSLSMGDAAEVRWSDGAACRFAIGGS